MLDGVIITVEIVIKPELAEQTIASIPALFDDTVTFRAFAAFAWSATRKSPTAC